MPSLREQYEEAAKDNNLRRMYEISCQWEEEVDFEAWFDPTVQVEEGDEDAEWVPPLVNAAALIDCGETFWEFSGWQKGVRSAFESWFCSSTTNAQLERSQLAAQWLLSTVPEGYPDEEFLEFLRAIARRDFCSALPKASCIYPNIEPGFYESRGMDWMLEFVEDWHMDFRATVNAQYAYRKLQGIPKFF